MTAANRPGGGSLFTLRLPIAGSPPELPGETVTSAPAGQDGGKAP